MKGKTHKMTKDTVEMLSRIRELGFDMEEAFALRRIAMTFHRWDEQECGDSNNYASFSIERDETTGRPYSCVYPHNPTDGCTRRATLIPDREAGAQRRLDKIIANHPEFVAYHQGDCRGASLYIVRKSDLNGSDINANYTKGLAVCD
jgi:hypothetical protein